MTPLSYAVAILMFSAALVSAAFAYWRRSIRAGVLCFFCLCTLLVS